MGATWVAHILTPLGAMTALGGPAGLAALPYDDEHADAMLRRAVATIGPVEDDRGRMDDVRTQLDEYFAGRRQSFSITLDLSLISGPFTRKVLETLTALPFGDVTTYGALAEDAGSPRAARAVGNALASNPIPVVIPCHRVLAGSGIGGYTGGLHRKRFLLELEGVPLDAL